jgi:hypothetical protein
MEKRCPLCLVSLDFGGEYYVGIIRCARASKIAEVFSRVRRFKVLDTTTAISRWLPLYCNIKKKLRPYPMTTFLGYSLWSVDQNYAVDIFREAVKENGTKRKISKHFEIFTRWTRPTSSLFIAELGGKIIFGKSYCIKDSIEELDARCILRTRNFARNLDLILRDWQAEIKVELFHGYPMVSKDALDSVVDVAEKSLQLHGRKKATFHKCSRYGVLWKKKNKS